MNDNFESKSIKIGNEVSATTREGWTRVILSIPVEFIFSTEQSAEDVERIALDYADNISGTIINHISTLGGLLSTNDFAPHKIMQIGETIETLGKINSGILTVFSNLQANANFRRDRNRKLKFVPTDVNDDIAERNAQLERFTTTEPTTANARTKAEIFSEKILTLKINSPEYTEMWHHFGALMERAMRGCICTPERMALLYPIFREINDEMDEEEKLMKKRESEFNLNGNQETENNSFVPNPENVPSISDIPHSRPTQKRTPTQKPKIRTKKAEKPKNK